MMSAISRSRCATGGASFFAASRKSVATSRRTAHTTSGTSAIANVKDEGPRCTPFNYTAGAA